MGGRYGARKHRDLASMFAWALAAFIAVDSATAERDGGGTSDVLTCPILARFFETEWQRHLPIARDVVFFPPAAVGDDALVAVTADSGLVAVSLDQGAIRWRVTSPASSLAAPFVGAWRVPFPYSGIAEFIYVGSEM